MNVQNLHHLLTVIGSQIKEIGLMLAGELLLHWSQWPLPFMDCAQEQDSPHSAGTVPRSWPNKQVMDKVQTGGPENVSVHSAWHQWSFLVVDNYVFFLNKCTSAFIFSLCLELQAHHTAMAVLF